MSKVRVACFAVSLDGYGAGPRQSLENPLGVGGTELHQWFFPTRTLQKMLFGKDEGTTGLDDDYARRGIENLGAWILGRNMFSPGRGAWDEAWKGWWGDNPPYHVPVFVLTHHPRKSIEMKGGTTFHFVTGGIDEALMRAKDAAGSKDVRIGGGAATIRSTSRRGWWTRCIWWCRRSSSVRASTCSRVSTWGRSATASWSMRCRKRRCTFD
jgi:dihydrofolate reductase